MKKNFLLLGVFCLSLLCQGVQAQVVPAVRGSAESKLQVGGGFNVWQTDWNKTEYGLTVFADYDVYRRLISLEGEGRFVSWGRENLQMPQGKADPVSERNFGVGPRISFRYHRWNPYVKVMGGIAKIEFGHYYTGYPNYTKDSYTYYAFGGGVDYRWSRHIRFRGEYQYQFWDDSDAKKIIYTPNGLTLGAAYRF